MRAAKILSDMLTALEDLPDHKLANRDDRCRAYHYAEIEWMSELDHMAMVSEQTRRGIAKGPDYDFTKEDDRQDILAEIEHHRYRLQLAREMMGLALIDISETLRKINDAKAELYALDQAAD